MRTNLRREFQDEEYRYSYAESFLNTKLAMQIKTLREQRDKTQDEVAQVAGTKQAGFSRFENVNHSSWKTDTLWKIARALGVRLDISFETFGSLIDEKERFSREYLMRPEFKDDLAFVARKGPQAEVILKVPATGTDAHVVRQDRGNLIVLERRSAPPRLIAAAIQANGEIGELTSWMNP